MKRSNEPVRASLPMLPLVLAAALLAGCAVDGDTGQSTLQGSAVGAAGGAAVGLLQGNFLSSALTGAVAGGAGGFTLDQIRKSQDDD